jgi:L-lactate utilization protein LutC
VSSVLIHKASELRPKTRAALEAELGRRLQDNAQVSTMVFVPHEAPTGKARREAGRRLKEHLNRVDARPKTAPETEMEAALDEALRSVRPGYRERE